MSMPATDFWTLPLFSDACERLKCFLAFKINHSNSNWNTQGMRKPLNYWGVTFPDFKLKSGLSSVNLIFIYTPSTKHFDNLSSIRSGISCHVQGLTNLPRTFHPLICMRYPVQELDSIPHTFQDVPAVAGRNDHCITHTGSSETVTQLIEKAISQRLERQDQQKHSNEQAVEWLQNGFILWLNVRQNPERLNKTV